MLFESISTFFSKILPVFLPSTVCNIGIALCRELKDLDIFNLTVFSLRTFILEYLFEQVLHFYLSNYILQ